MHKLEWICRTGIKLSRGPVAFIIKFELGLWTYALMKPHCRGHRNRIEVGFITTMYLCNQCLWPLMVWVRIPPRRGVLDTTLCDQVCQWIATVQWFSPGTPVSSTKKTDHHDIAKILRNSGVKYHNPHSSPCTLYVHLSLHCAYNVFFLCQFEKPKWMPPLEIF